MRAVACVPLHACTCMRAPVCVHPHTCTCRCAPARVRMHACTRMSAPACRHLHACTCMLAPACVHRHACTRKCAPAREHLHALLRALHGAEPHGRPGGPAQRGVARHGTARDGAARSCPAGLARLHDRAQHVTARRGVARQERHFSFNVAGPAPPAGWIRPAAGISTTWGPRPQPAGRYPIFFSPHRTRATGSAQKGRHPHPSPGGR